MWKLTLKILKMRARARFSVPSEKQTVKGVRRTSMQDKIHLPHSLGGIPYVSLLILVWARLSDQAAEMKAVLVDACWFVKGPSRP